MAHGPVPPHRVETVHAPRRRGNPWLWVLAGCGGCAILVIGALGVIGLKGAELFQQATNVGPVTQASMQQSLGPDVPLYPNGTFNEPGTRAMLVSYRMAEKVAGKKAGSLFKGCSFQLTDDTPEQIYKYYDTELAAAGWKSTSESTNAEQRMYQKGGDTLIVQMQSAQGEGKKHAVVLIRGQFGGMQPPPVPNGPGAPPSPQEEPVSRP